MGQMIAATYLFALSAAFVAMEAAPPPWSWAVLGFSVWLGTFVPDVAMIGHWSKKYGWERKSKSYPHDPPSSHTWHLWLAFFAAPAYLFVGLLAWLCVEVFRRTNEGDER